MEDKDNECPAINYILLNQKFLIPYISIYRKRRKKGYTTCHWENTGIIG